jgi:hypothetical protein
VAWPCCSRSRQPACRAAARRPAHVVAGQQQAHFFKGLAHGGHRSSQAAFGQAEARAERCVGPAPSTKRCASRVAGVDHAAGKDGRAAAQVVVALGAAQHQHFEALAPSRSSSSDAARRASAGDV